MTMDDTNECAAIVADTLRAHPLVTDAEERHTTDDEEPACIIVTVAHLGRFALEVWGYE